MRLPLTYAGLLAPLLQLAACSETAPYEQKEEHGCSVGGRMFPVGTQWTCSDGCNFCECVADDGGVGVLSTLIGCASPPGPAADMLFCTEGGVHRHGDRWSCGECGTCTCVDGKIDRVPSCVDPFDSAGFAPDEDAGA